MAVPTTRTSFKAYCLRRLGYPVIDINVDDEQVEDRIDEALLYYQDYHFDGSEKKFIAHAVTATDITNKYITLDTDVIGVVRVLEIGSSLNIASLFNIRYQMHLHDLFDFSNSQNASYVMARRHIEQIEEIFVGQKPIRFNRHTDKLYIDMDWSSDVSAGEYVVIEAYLKTDPDTYGDIWNDRWLQRYATALIKRQWGENLKKMAGIQLPGGITMDGKGIYEEATSELDKLETEMINSYSLPVMDMTN